jgi:hypothetical protein
MAGSPSTASEGPCQPGLKRSAHHRAPGAGAPARTHDVDRPRAAKILPLGAVMRQAARAWGPRRVAPVRTAEMDENRVTATFFSACELAHTPSLSLWNILVNQ